MLKAGFDKMIKTIQLTVSAIFFDRMAHLPATTIGIVPTKSYNSHISSCILIIVKFRYLWLHNN